MQKRTGWILGSLALLAGIGVLANAEPARLARLTALAASSMVRVAEHSLARAEERGSRLHLERALDPLAQRAEADEVLQFKPVSAESAARVEARTRRAHDARRTAPTTAAAPETLSPLPEEDQTSISPPPPLPPVTTRHAGEMMRIGSDIHVEKDQTVDGDVVAISGDVKVDGHVKGSVQSLGGDVYLGSTARVDGDVAAVKGELHEEPGAYVGGQRVTALSGRVSRTTRHIIDGRDIMSRPLREMWRFGRTLAWLLIMLGMVWLILRISPQRTSIAVDLLRRETAASLGIGLLTCVLLVPSLVALALVTAILCVTIIGIPVGVAAIFAYFLLLIVLAFWGFVVGAAWLGNQFRRVAPGDSLLRHAMVGTFAIIGMRATGHLISVIPFFGFLGGFLVVMSWILSSFTMVLGAGALLRSESASGYLGRWWRGWRGGPISAGDGTMPVPPMPPPAPPSPPSAFAPPPPPFGEPPVSPGDTTPAS